MGTLLMSARERRRLEALSRVKHGSLTLSKASALLGISYRQGKRLWARYQAEGDQGVIHRLRGRPSNRQPEDGIRARSLELYREKYADFGPTLAAEYLAREDGITIACQTLRRWLTEGGLWSVKSRRAIHRRRRARKEQLGEMVQMDGSWHDWFEGRRGWASLMVMIDDATNLTYARFFEQETTSGAMETFLHYVQKHGVPRSLYVDRDSIYRPGREETLEDRLSGQEPTTQFGRAMKELNVRLILANSPQAKGRVERRHGLFQDRLVKGLRLAKINDLASANAFLEKKFLRDLARRFVVKAAVKGDLHRRSPSRSKLDRILSRREFRRVQNDWTVCWANRWLQLTATNRTRALAGKQVEVVEQLDGRVRLFHRGRELSYRELSLPPTRPPKPSAKKLAPTKPSWKPAADHPWRGKKLRDQAPASVACAPCAGA